VSPRAPVDIHETSPLALPNCQHGRSEWYTGGMENAYFCRAGKKGAKTSSQRKETEKKGGVRGMNRVPDVAGVPLSKSVPGNHCAKFSFPHKGRCSSAPFKRNGANIKSDLSNTWPSTLTRRGKPQFIFQLLSWFDLTRGVSYASIPRRSGTVP
jgi:hypothetical protein